MNNFYVSKEQLKILDVPRKVGLSGHLRIKDSDFLIDKCIKSCIDFLDELIITYNPSSDNTEQELNKWKNNKKIKIYKYPYNIIFNNKKIENNVLSFANYSNYGLQKITYKWYIKIDVDQFYDTEKMIKLKKDIIKNDNDKNIYILNGLNIFEYNDNFGIYIGNRFNNYWLSPLNGGYDHAIFVPNANTYYVSAKKDRYSIESINYNGFSPIFKDDIFWIHFGTFKYNDLLTKYLKNKNYKKYFLPISQISDFDFSNALFFKYDRLSYKDKWNLFYRLIYCVIRKFHIFPLNLNDYYRLMMYKRSSEKIYSSKKIIDFYFDDFKVIQEGFKKNNISLLDMKIKI